MASPDVIDVDSLLNPISEDAPTGADVRDDASPTSTYQVIKSERNQARAAERQSVHDGESSEAASHWRQITELAPQILGTQSKDLEVASWYAEAMLRRHGFAGLRDAFRLIDGLLSNFWETLHPMPDEYGVETRVSCLSGLNGEGAEGVLVAPIRKVALTEGDFPGPFGLWQYRQALEAQKSPDEQTRQAKIANLGFSSDDIQKSVTESSDDFVINLRDDIQACIEHYRSIGKQLDEFCGIHEAPPTSTIINVLEETLGAVNHLGKDKFPAEADEAAAEVEEPAGDSSTTGSATAVAQKAKGPVETREDAFKQLLEISEFFKKTEPHSPVSYILQKAVKWGRMPLADLIGELIPDANARDKYTELTGVSGEQPPGA